MTSSVKRCLCVLVAMTVLLTALQLSVFASDGEESGAADQPENGEVSSTDSNDRSHEDDGEGVDPAGNTGGDALSSEQGEDNPAQDPIEPSDELSGEPADDETGRVQDDGLAPEHELQNRGLIRVVPAQVEIVVGEAYDLLDGVSARGVDGDALDVSVEDDGGFDADLPGEYLIAYAAQDAAADDTYRGERTVRVVAPRFMAAPMAGSMVLVDDFTGLRDAVQNPASVGVILTDNIVLEDTLELSRDFTFISLDGKRTITAPGSERHFVVTGDAKLQFSDVVLDGDGAGGGIKVEQAIDSLELVGAQIVNCRQTNGSALFSVNCADSIVITGGSFSGNRTNSSDGAAMVVQGMSSLVIDDVLFKDNQAGYHAGAIYMESIASTEVSGTFVDNVAQQSGGAIYAVNVGDLQISGSQFQGNESQGGDRTGGGAIKTIGTKNIQIEASRFVDNYASFTGSAVYLYGHSDEAQGIESAIIHDCVFEENRTDWNGALGIENYAQDVRITSSSFVRNTAAKHSGGINLAFGVRKVLIDDVTLDNNEAGVRGGAIAFETSTKGTFEMTNSSILNNTAGTERGGGLFLNIYGWDSNGNRNGISAIRGTTIKGNTAGTEGGGIMLCNSLLEIEDCVIADNTAGTYGGGVALEKDFPDQATVGGKTDIVRNTAGRDGGGIFVPNERVSRVFVGADIEFDGNRASSFALGFKDAADEAVHEAQVAATHFSRMPGSDARFSTAYNNYDINYTNDLPDEDHVRVSFVGNGGTIRESGSGYHVVAVKKGSLVDQPAVTRGGYTFLGWYLDDGTFLDEWDFASDTVEQSLTLYAAWSDNGGTTPPGGGGNGGESVGPGGSSGSGSGSPDVTSIPDADIPLGLVEIVDDDVPLGALPKTGGVRAKKTGSGLGALGVIAAAIFGVRAGTKEESED